MQPMGQEARRCLESKSQHVCDLTFGNHSGKTHRCGNKLSFAHLIYLRALLVGREQGQPAKLQSLGFVAQNASPTACFTQIDIE